MVRLRAATVLLVSLATLQCGDGGVATRGEPGTMVLSLATPHGDDGAVVFTLRGTGMTGLKAASRDYVLFSRASGPDELSVVVVGDIAPGPLARVDVPDIGGVDGYSATIHQAAARDHVLRGNLDAYRLTVSPTLNP